MVDERRGIVVSARAELERMMADDSRLVSQAARKALDPPPDAVDEPEQDVQRDQDEGAPSGCRRARDLGAEVVAPPCATARDGNAVSSCQPSDRVNSSP